MDNVNLNDCRSFPCSVRRHCLYSHYRLADGGGGFGGLELEHGVASVYVNVLYKFIYTDVGVLVGTDTAAHVENTCVCKTGKFILGAVYGVC